MRFLGISNFAPPLAPAGGISDYISSVITGQSSQCPFHKRASGKLSSLNLSLDLVDALSSATNVFFIVLFSSDHRGG
ncbi:hypothetical protein K7X08_010400 [Anisodus acutangulus]|uniref:Uncharacterized protein n=1 Tax=Anisodus acutangulus TaxID=402998 RepID=A0A9Q1RUE6_9SOLA|nr:hypothetical protein K7X08_010400 [Anisodus acutangulus]